MQRRPARARVAKVVLVAGALTLCASLVPAAAQVASTDDLDGSPRAGSDPADQPHPSSLARVSERGRPSDVEDARVNNGTARLARDVRGTTRRVLPSQVLNEQSRRGGCTKGYGEAGQCLPVGPPARHTGHAPGHGAGAPGRWTCEAVRVLFPDGLVVQGVDRLRLDSDRDGTACGPADA